jgi:hypothetical protein
VWLSGAAGARHGGETRNPVRERLLTTFFAPARQRLGHEAWDAAGRRGAAASFAEAIVTGLQEAGSPVPAR